MVNCSKATRVKKVSLRIFLATWLLKDEGLRADPACLNNTQWCLFAQYLERKYRERKGSSKFILHNGEMLNTTNKKHCRRVVVITKFSPVRNGLKLSTSLISCITLSNEQIYETFTSPNLSTQCHHLGQDWAYPMKQKCKAFSKSEYKHRPYF